MSQYQNITANICRMRVISGDICLWEYSPHLAVPGVNHWMLIFIDKGTACSQYPPKPHHSHDHHTVVETPTHWDTSIFGNIHMRWFQSPLLLICSIPIVVGFCWVLSTNIDHNSFNHHSPLTNRGLSNFNAWIYMSIIESLLLSYYCIIWSHYMLSWTWCFFNMVVSECFPKQSQTIPIISQFGSLKTITKHPQWQGGVYPSERAPSQPSGLLHAHGALNACLDQWEPGMDRWWKQYHENIILISNWLITSILKKHIWLYII